MVAAPGLAGGNGPPHNHRWLGSFDQGCSSDSLKSNRHWVASATSTAGHTAPDRTVCQPVTAALPSHRRVDTDRLYMTWSARWPVAVRLRHSRAHARARMKAFDTAPSI